MGSWLKMNKKGYVQYIYYVIGGLLILALISSLGWYTSSTASEEEIESEKLKSKELQGQLYEIQTDLDEANKIIKKQNSQIQNITIQLSNYQNSKGVFPLFWVEDIYLTQNWILVINLVLFSFSLITIKFIINLSKKR